MSYMADISESLGKQLRMFVTLHRHQLAGQAANLAFWTDELQHCLDVIDDYKSRFTRMKAGQATYVANHQTTEFYLPDERWYSPGNVAPPKRIDPRELQDLKQSLCDAMYEFLVRCRTESLIDEATFQGTSDRLGITAARSNPDR
jgi:hypothetical protein